MLPSRTQHASFCSPFPWVFGTTFTSYIVSSSFPEYSAATAKLSGFWSTCASALVRYRLPSSTCIREQSLSKFRKYIDVPDETNIAFSPLSSSFSTRLVIPCPDLCHCKIGSLNKSQLYVQNPSIHMITLSYSTYTISRRLLRFQQQSIHFQYCMLAP